MSTWNEKNATESTWKRKLQNIFHKWEVLRYKHIDDRQQFGSSAENPANSFEWYAFDVNA